MGWHFFGTSTWSKERDVHDGEGERIQKVVLLKALEETLPRPGRTKPLESTSGSIIAAYTAMPGGGGR